MSGRTKIEWATMVWNPVTGCTKVSEGCRNCFAERMAARFQGDFKVRLHEDRLELPLHWRKPQRIFVDSMSDLFHEAVPFAFINRVFGLCYEAPQHTYLVLTKRPVRALEIMGRFMPRKSVVGDGPMFEWPPPNFWLGVSVEDQATADGRIPLLLQAPVAHRFVSVEPMLGPVDIDQDDVSWLGSLRHEDDTYPTIQWVICGGESGPGARPMHPDWARRLRDQCQCAGVPFFFKQWGEWAHYSQISDSDLYECPEQCSPVGSFFRVGKTRAGHLLDGQGWHQFPDGMVQ